MSLKDQEQYISELAALTKSSSELVLAATICYLTEEVTQKEAAEKYGVKRESITRLSIKLRKLDAKITELWILKNKAKINLEM